MPADGDPPAARGDYDGIVQPQSDHRGATHWRDTNHPRAIIGPREMIEPPLLAGIEERHGSTSNGIDGVPLGSLVLIAPVTRQPEVCSLRRPALRLGHEVIDHQWDPRDGDRRLAVPAAVAGIRFQLPPQRS
jgi:hypothetical protein